MIRDNSKGYILELAKKGVRDDGRGLLNYRDIKIEYDISNNAEGSAAVTIGKTRVVCGVKLSTGEPYPDKPDEGSIVVNAEFAPISSPTFEPGAPGEESIELARVVDRGIRESRAVDFKKLCIKSGEKMWMVMIDLYIQNHDGNLIDAAALAAIAALTKAKFPKYDMETDTIDYHEHKKDKLPLVRHPIACTIHKMNGTLFVDPTFDEEALSDARLTVTVSEDGNINAMQKGGQAGLSEDEILKGVEIALEKSNEIRKHLK
ncbi:MAG: exosome complex protein Rrp42 [Candidatus Nanoarchaeia archaeon]|nr:exosome complex protein Rrp42 [Candidatus Nanoarchaeia archaeon]MDD5239509.1 exosome complex protein Rrp42 [Candidatus Nanoarchaeia archaeon]